MSSELKPKVIEGVAPVTLAECVYYGDGTTSTVKELLDNIIASGGSSGSTGSSGTTVISGNRSVEGGTVFFENTAERQITYSDGFLLINGKIYAITSGTAVAESVMDWNPNNPNYTSYFVYNINSLSFAFRGAFKTNPTLQDGDYIIFLLYSDSNSNIYMKTLNYDNRYVKRKQLPYEKVINRLTIIGDSLTAGGKWCDVLDKHDNKLKVLSRNIAALSGATLYNQGLAYANSVEAGDTVIFFMGTNDCLREVTIGDPSTDTSSSNTFCGVFKKIIETIYDKDKTIRMLVVGGSPLNGFESGLGHPAKYRADVIPYSNALKEICSQYAIPYLNLLENIGINSYNTSATQVDGCHYTPEMYKYLGNMIFEKLYSIL